MTLTLQGNLCHDEGHVMGLYVQSHVESGDVLE